MNIILFEDHKTTPAFGKPRFRQIQRAVWRFYWEILQSTLNDYQSIPFYQRGQRRKKSLLLLLPKCSATGDTSPPLLALPVPRCFHSFSFEKASYIHSLKVLPRELAS